MSPYRSRINSTPLAIRGIVRFINARRDVGGRSPWPLRSGVESPKGVLYRCSEATQILEMVRWGCRGTFTIHGNNSTDGSRLQGGGAWIGIPKVGSLRTGRDLEVMVSFFFFFFF
jgi:hypothetical protein